MDEFDSWGEFEMKVLSFQDKHIAISLIERQLRRGVG